ncbi:unnamed protein product [Toxocara canis]|uniref:Glycogenin-1 n=1 Tax=Toxocara canis TaxID=6265 RepID=A0A183U761_TOXCA|nr:unnamed protein product [Toxocara canis]
MTEAWVTLATTDGYAVGALVLAQSLKASMTTKKLHCMVTTAVSQPLLEELRAVYDAVTTVNVFDSGDSVNLGLIGRPDLGVTFTKIHCWRLTQYTKCVFLDADCLVGIFKFRLLKFTIALYCCCLKKDLLLLNHFASQIFLLL